MVVKGLLPELLLRRLIRHRSKFLRKTLRLIWPRERESIRLSLPRVDNDISRDKFFLSFKQRLRAWCSSSLLDYVSAWKRWKSSSQTRERSLECLEIGIREMPFRRIPDRWLAGRIHAKESSLSRGGYSSEAWHGGNVVDSTSSPCTRFIASVVHRGSWLLVDRFARRMQNREERTATFPSRGFLVSSGPCDTDTDTTRRKEKLAKRSV